jgi:hypothetical protein
MAAVPPTAAGASIAATGRGDGDGMVDGGTVAAVMSGAARGTRLVSASSALTVGIAFSVGSPGSSTSSIGTSV